ncbi:MAG TPA: MMPL family transporter [Galbitalea sp.]|jgi:RND superfamily putative drug exporter|nr:MMPL family transporter [Galbitalea sp.]
MATFLARIGRFATRRKWLVLATWVVLLLLAVAGAATLSQPESTTFNIPGLQSVKTLDTINKDFSSGSGSSGNVVFAAPKGQKLTAADAATVATLTANLAKVHGVTSAIDPFTAKVKTISPQGRIGFITVDLAAKGPSIAVQKGINRAMDAARSSRLEVEASSDLVTAASPSSNQAVGILLALIVLFITFGSLLAAGLPLVTALVGLGTGVAAIYTATSFVQLNSVAPVLAILLALAVGIDYSLFIVNRHKRQVLEGMPVDESIARALGTAGTAVFFAAVTVIIALAGLSVVGVDFLTQMGLSAAFAVLIAMLAALTLTPAMLAILGRRILGGRARKRLAAGLVKSTHHPARRWVEGIGRHPILAMVGSLVVLAVLATPVLSLRLGLPDDGSQPSSDTNRQAYDLMATGFGAGTNGPLVVLADYSATPTTAGVGALVGKLDAVKDVSRVVPSGVSGHEVLLTVIPSSGPSDARTTTLVTALRDLRVAPKLEVSGQTAVAIDVSQRLLNALPLYLALVIGFAFILLLIVFRSVLIPLKATISFVLSLGATLGCVVAVFQFGWLGAAFQVDPAGPLLAFLPIIVVGVLFGLSMDYEMFLVSGMRERFAHGAAPHDAVASGFANGAKVVAAAALIMIGVFGNGAFNGSTTTRPIAFALAAGVLVDAFVVRMTLVPAVMFLLGRSAWWLPRWLQHIVPQVDIEGAALERATRTTEPEQALASVWRAATGTRAEPAPRIE